MKGINKVILIGRVGKQPEIRTSATGDLTIAGFSIATDESYKDKSGNKVEKIEWHKIVAYGRLADIIRDYVRKGAKLYIEGKLQTHKWQDKTTGQDRYTTEIIANEMQMLDSKSETQQVENKTTVTPVSDDLDDDIPF